MSKKKKTILQGLYSLIQLSGIGLAIYGGMSGISYLIVIGVLLFFLCIVIGLSMSMGRSAGIDY